MPPAGWYPDPEGGAAPRWWDGQAWAAPTPVPVAQPATQPVSFDKQTFPPAPGTPSYPPQLGQAPTGPWSQPGGAWRPASTGNSAAFAAMGVSALYIVLAVFTHVVLLGFIPAAMTVRSFRRGEKLAPVALVVAVVAIGIAIAALAHG